MMPVVQQLKVVLGVVLLATGIAGTLIPIVPGLPIMLAGFALIGSDHPIARNLKARLRRWQVWRKR